MSGYNESRAVEPIFVSVKEAAKILGKFPWSVYLLCDEGAIDATRDDDGRWLVSLNSVRAYGKRLLEVAS